MGKAGSLYVTDVLGCLNEVSGNTTFSDSQILGWLSAGLWEFTRKFPLSKTHRFNTVTGETMYTGANVGLAFVQPANTSIQAVSFSAADTTQKITVYGNRNGLGDVVYSEQVTLTGTTAVSFVTYTDWTTILATELDGTTAGTITLKTSAGTTITTITAGSLTKGIVSVTDTDAHDEIPRIVADGTSTKQVGLKGTDSNGTTIYDSHALNGTTSEKVNKIFYTATKLYVGDIAATTGVTLKVGDVRTFALPSGFVFSEHLTFDGYGMTPSESIRNIDFHASMTASLPNIVALREGSMFFDPIPSGIKEVILYYYGTEGSIAASTVTSLPDDFDSAITEYALNAALKSVGDYQAAADHYANFFQSRQEYNSRQEDKTKIGNRKASAVW